MFHVIRVTVFLFFFSVPVFAQNTGPECIYTLSGQVIDDHDLSPLGFAVIQIPELNRSAIGDSLGFYKISGLCKGEYMVICTHIGCEPIEEKVKIRGNTTWNFYPEHHEEELREVSILTARVMKHETHSHETADAQMLDDAAGKSLGETLKSLTGLSTLKTGPTISKPVIHGVHSNRILIFNNGIRQEDQQWGAEHAPEIDPFTASRIIVVKGAATVRYGSDAIGGVILVEPARLPDKPKFSGTLRAIGMSNGRMGNLGGMVEGGVKKWKGFGWRLQGTGKVAGDMQAPDYNLSNTGAREYGMSAAMGLKRQRHESEIYYSLLTRKLGILRASHIGNLTDLENAVNSSVPWYVEDFTYELLNPRQEITHHLVKAKNLFKLNERWRMESLYGFQFNNRKEFDIRRGARSSRPALNMNLQTHALDVSLENIGHPHLKSTMGVSGFFQSNYNVPGTGTGPLIPNYYTYSAGVFLVEKYIREKWEAEAGVRYDYRYLDVSQPPDADAEMKTKFHFHNFSATAGGLYHPHDDVTLRTNAGISFRPPNISELFSQGLHHGSSAIEEGDFNLISEKGLKWVTSIDYEFGEILDFCLLGYVNYITDYIYLQPQDEFRLTIRGAFPVFNYVQTNALLRGFDFTSKIRVVRNLFIRNNISVVRASDLSRDDFLFGIPSERFENALAYERGKWGRFNEVRLNFGVMNVLRQNRAPDGMDFIPPPDAYFLMNVTVSGKVPFNNQTQLGIQLTVENLLNKSYRDYLNRFRYYADDVGRNFIVRLFYSF